MKLFQLLPKKLYDFACNLPRAVPKGQTFHGHATRQTFHGYREQNVRLAKPLPNPSACASTPKICPHLRNLRFPVVFCVS